MRLELVYILPKKLVTCHCMLGWNLLEADVEIEFRQRHAQSDLNLRQNSRNNVLILPKGG